MRSPQEFIVKPVKSRYNNTKKIGDKELILNSEIYTHQFVNREAEVLQTPIINDSDIKKGDIVIVHHNVFRRWHNQYGVEKNSASYYKEDMYFVRLDQIFLMKRNNKWNSIKGFCFVKPIKSNDIFSVEKERPLVGIMKFVDKDLSNINVGDLVGFSPNSEYEFVIDGERLYRVTTNSITIKYEYQGDEEEYNPSWA
jgi:hypothetical protein